MSRPFRVDGPKADPEVNLRVGNQHARHVTVGLVHEQRGDRGGTACLRNAMVGKGARDHETIVLRVRPSRKAS